MSFRTLLTLLTAISLLFAPTFAPVAAASVGPADHHEQMMTAGHCKSMPDSDMDQDDSKSCCVAMCVAIAVEPLAASDPQDLPRSAKAYSLASVFVGLPAEIATPPPRSA